MPTDPKILGFANRWYTHAIETATRLTLPSGRQIRLISASAFIATKFEAFNDRGRGDLLGSHDLEDILNVLEGRPALVAEIAAESTAVRQYLRNAFGMLKTQPNVQDYLPGLLAQDGPLDERVAIISSRIKAIASLA